MIEEKKESYTTHFKSYGVPFSFVLNLKVAESMSIVDNSKNTYI